MNKNLLSSNGRMGQSRTLLEKNKQKRRLTVNERSGEKFFAERCSSLFIKSSVQATDFSNACCINECSNTVIPGDVYGSSYTTIKADEFCEFLEILLFSFFLIIRKLGE